MTALSYFKDSQFYSFEPSETSFNQLSSHAQNNVVLEQLAFGEKDSEQKLVHGESGDSTSYIASSDTEGESVSVTSIDNYCGKHKIENIDILKIDTEGYEYKILQGAKHMIAEGNIKVIQFEFGVPNNETFFLADFFELLEEKYDIYRILKHGIYKIQYKHYYEIITPTNFVAILKNDLNATN